MDAVLSQTISAIRAGHDVERNFEILFQLWHRQVSAYYRNQGSDPQAADDLMQEVFLTVFARIGDLRDDRAFPAWLFGIARNKWLHHLENQRRTAARQGEAADIADLRPSHLQVAIATQQRTQLREALEELPPQMRACVKLSVIDELRYGDIAERLGVSVNSVKVQIHRAKKVLAERLGPVFQSSILLLVYPWMMK